MRLHPHRLMLLLLLNIYSGLVIEALDWRTEDLNAILALDAADFFRRHGTDLPEDWFTYFGFAKQLVEKELERRK